MRNQINGTEFMREVMAHQTPMAEKGVSIGAYHFHGNKAVTLSMHWGKSKATAHFEAGKDSTIDLETLNDLDSPVPLIYEFVADVTRGSC